MLNSHEDNFYSTNAGHYIHWDDPRAVINSIKLLVESLKE